MNNSLSFQKNLFSSPGRIIMCAMAALILLGTFLLWLPMSHTGELSFTNALFTATSATCVTGLMVVPLSSFTFIGHCILLFLMQIGALGLVTLTIFLISLFFDLRLSTRYLTGEMFEIEGWSVSQHLLLFIVLMTAVVEGMGTIFVFFTIKNNYPPSTALFYSFFHSVSSFTSTGLSFFDPNASVIPHNIPLLFITGLLALMGGMGFVVWQEVYLYVKSLTQQKRFHWSLHSKVVFSTTALIIGFASVMFFYLEHILHNESNSSLGYAIITSIFNAITCRSAGITTYHIPFIHFATLFLIMIISFIGSSPGSTGSGIKTTTFALFLASIRATITRRSDVELKGRTIPHEQIFKAMAILSVSLSWVALTIFCLLITEQGWRFIDISFEAFSAFSNIGLTTGITPYLSPIGKYIIMISMFMGRVGSLTLLLAFRKQKEKTEFHYPEERVILG